MNYLEAQYKNNVNNNKKKNNNNSSNNNNINNLFRPLEGTIILQIDFAIKQDQELGKEFLKGLTGSTTTTTLANVLVPSDNWTPFSIAMLLSIGRRQRFEEKVFGILKFNLLSSYRNSLKQQNDKLSWVSGK